MNLNKIKKSKGFTLIELMIVVAIIGILAAVAIPKFADLVTKSKEATCKANLGAVRSALSIYYSDNDGEYPTNVFVGLTSGSKYMPAVGNTPSLGRYEIPKHPANNGHTGGVYANASAATSWTSVAVYPPVATDNSPLLYEVNTSSGAGEIWVNCTHQDTKGSTWTAY